MKDGGLRRRDIYAARKDLMSFMCLISQTSNLEHPYTRARRLEMCSEDVFLDLELPMVPAGLTNCLLDRLR